MVAIKKIQSPKKTGVKGRTLHDILHIAKKQNLEGRTLNDILHEGLMHQTARFQHFTLL